MRGSPGSSGGENRARHVLAGRISSPGSDNTFLAWVPVRRRTTHRTHGEVIGVGAQRDHAALRPLPARPYVVADRHLRQVGKDCLVAFEANLYSVPAGRVFHRQLVEVRASAATISLHATVPDEHGVTLLAVHPRAVGRGARLSTGPGRRCRRACTRTNRGRCPLVVCTATTRPAARRGAGRCGPCWPGPIRPGAVHRAERTKVGTSITTVPPPTRRTARERVVTARIRATAAKLGLPHLTETLAGTCSEPMRRRWATWTSST